MIKLTVRVRRDASFHVYSINSIWIIIRSTKRRLSTRSSLQVTIISQRFDPNDRLVSLRRYFPAHAFNKCTHLFPYSKILFILRVRFRRRVSKVATWS
ncbi:hypothetical protein Hanom_Chr04g00294181 [Helianthus anomalus]